MVAFLDKRYIIIMTVVPAPLTVASNVAQGTLLILGEIYGE